MKSFFGVIVLLILCSANTNGLASQATLMQQYLDARYKTLHEGQNNYCIDFNNVLSVINDRDCYYSKSLGLADSTFCVAGNNHWWVIFKNGSRIYLHNCVDIYNQYINFRTFIRSHPEFHSIQ